MRERGRVEKGETVEKRDQDEKMERRKRGERRKRENEKMQICKCRNRNDSPDSHGLRRDGGHCGLLQHEKNVARRGKGHCRLATKKGEGQKKAEAQESGALCRPQGLVIAASDSRWTRCVLCRFFDSHWPRIDEDMDTKHCKDKRQKTWSSKQESRRQEVQWIRNERRNMQCKYMPQLVSLSSCSSQRSLSASMLHQGQGSVRPQQWFYLSFLFAIAIASSRRTDDSLECGRASPGNAFE